MLTLYPGNRMEDLVVLLERILSKVQNHPLHSETIVVQNPGMQHWLSLELARHRGVVMNINFPLPVKFFWHIIKNLLPDHNLPEQSSYHRDVLVWRLYDLLETPEVIEDERMNPASNYWFGESAKEQSALKRFQLATQLADLYEQYLIYRPDWIKAWEQPERLNKPLHWQGLLWRLLVQQDSQHPLALLALAGKQLEMTGKLLIQTDPLPKHLFLFGLNVLPPVWLEFLKKLSKKGEVHFFMLNPSDEYWGGLQRESQIARQRAQWIRQDKSPGEILIDVGNPLLGSWGQQGQTFLNQLTECSDNELTVFESPGRDTQLHALQDDLLKLSDGREKELKKNYPRADDSLVVSQAHSALREVQGLHDWLLNYFEKNSELKPRDVLVMCPQIEDYSSCIDAVFTRSGEWPDSNRIALPCTIADRALSDSEPLIAVFSELLQLPDSRFQVSQIFSCLRLESVQRKFALEPDDIKSYELWLSQAALHWGIDGRHKAKMLQQDQANSRFTWKQALDRLLLGFAYADSEQIYQGQLLLPWVEGDQAIRLGRLILFLEQLQIGSNELQKERSALAWGDYLKRILDDLFDPVEDELLSRDRILDALESLMTFAAQAGLDNKPLPLSVVREVLDQHFSQPEQGQHFLVGQVTFCSMIPMRAIPFKVIAVLGLNDGCFPRQRFAPEFDLMVQEPPRQGDRSRRGEDRYLFLEAVLSARDALYLSYQGHDVKNNNPRPPSVVLAEMLDYMQKGYAGVTERSLPLQPFSPANYQGSLYSYDNRWLALSHSHPVEKNRITLPKPDEPHLDKVDGAVPVKVEEWVRFFDHPVKAFAQARLGLYFDRYHDLVLTDAEPFISSYIDRYQVQESLISCLLEGRDTSSIRQQWVLRGALPDTPIVVDEITQWEAKSRDFVAVLKEKGVQNMTMESVEVSLSAAVGERNAESPFRWALHGKLPIIRAVANTETRHCVDHPVSLLFWRMASMKGKDLLRLWFHHLLAQITLGRNVTTLGLFRGGKEKLEQVTLGEVENPQACLNQWLYYWQKAQCQPLLVGASFALACYSTKKPKKGVITYDSTVDMQSVFEQKWCPDSYSAWFWPETPLLKDFRDDLVQLYDPLFQCISISMVSG